MQAGHRVAGGRGSRGAAAARCRGRAGRAPAASAGTPLPCPVVQPPPGAWERQWYEDDDFTVQRWFVWGCPCDQQPDVLCRGACRRCLLSVPRCRYTTWASNAVMLLYSTTCVPYCADAAARRAAQVLYDFCVARSDLRGAAAAQLAWARRLRAEAPASAAALADTADALGAPSDAWYWTALLAVAPRQASHSHAVLRRARACLVHLLTLPEVAGRLGRVILMPLCSRRPLLHAAGKTVR